MPRLTPLPETLRYLEPFRKQLAKVKPEEIDESVDLSLLNKLLLERIRGIPTEKGKEKLELDLEALERWLSFPTLCDNGAMMFVRGYLMALPELVDRPLQGNAEPVSSQSEIRIDFPPEAKLKKLRGGMLKFNWLRTIIFVLRCDKEYYDHQIKEFHEGMTDKLSKVSVVKVEFGDVVGFRRLVDLSVVGSMNVDYALTVPGGYATITLLKKGTAINPSQFEAFFHTLRVI